MKQWNIIAFVKETKALPIPLKKKKKKKEKKKKKQSNFSG